MKVLSHNAAILLFEKIESLRYQPHESWRSIYLKLSDKQARYNNDLRTGLIVNAISSLLAYNDGIIYPCDDGDIFILFQGSLKSVVNLLSSHFGNLDSGQLRGKSQDSLFFTFDLGKHWEGFYKLCEAKYLEALARAEELRGEFTYCPQPAKNLTAFRA